MLEITTYTILTLTYLCGFVLYYVALFLGPAPFEPRYRAWLCIVFWPVPFVWSVCENVYTSLLARFRR